MSKNQNSRSSRGGQSFKQASWRTIARAVKELSGAYRHDEKLAVAGILVRESGLPLSASRAEKKDRGPVLEEEKWELVRYLFGIRSKADLEAVVALAHLEKRIDKAIPDRDRDRLDARVRRLALKEKATAPDAEYHPPLQVDDLEPVVELVNRSPLRLCRWYVARLISHLHELAWSTTATKREPARELGSRLGRAVTQPLGKGRVFRVDPYLFRRQATLYEEAASDAFAYATQLRREAATAALLKKDKALSRTIAGSTITREGAICRLSKAHPQVPTETLAFLLDTARLPQVKTPHHLLITALRKRFPINSDRHVYRRLRLT